MELVTLVILLALIQYHIFGYLVGRARVKYGVSAPAISGHPIFERFYRVHQNTLEQLAVFLPAILAYGYFGNETIAALLGLLFILGRLVYLLAYLKDPKTRLIGFVMGLAANVTLIIAAFVSIVLGFFEGAAAL